MSGIYGCGLFPTLLEDIFNSNLHSGICKLVTVQISKFLLASYEISREFNLFLNSLLLGIGLH